MVVESRLVARHFVIFGFLFFSLTVYGSRGPVSADDKPLPVNSSKSPAATEKASVDKSVEELAAAAKKSVVVITFTGRDGQKQGLGAGFVVREDGLIATNLHVIGEARPIQVELFDGRKFDVTSVYATQRSQDLALLKIDVRDLPVIPLGDSDELQDGQPVFAIGNPLGLERSVVSGVLSGRRDIEGRSMLQIALPIERGNSGGPLLDLQGRAHGLLTLKSLMTKNLGFAMTVNALKPLIEKPNPIPMSRWLTIGVLDPDVWTVLPGARWKQRAGIISVEGIGDGFGGRALCLATQSPPEVPFETSVQVKFTPDGGAAGLVFHADGKDKHYGFYPSAGKVRFSRFDGPDVYSWSVLREVAPPFLKKEGWNSLKIRVEAERILCYLNGKLLFELNDTTYKSGKVGICKFRQTEAEFKHFRVGKTLDDSLPSEESVARINKKIEQLTAEDEVLAEAVRTFSDEDSGVVSILEQQAKLLDERAIRIRRIAADVVAKKTLAQFQAAVNGSKVDLLRGALLISKMDNPELDVEEYIRDVTRHVKRIRATFAEGANEQDRFAALNRYLFEEQGFHGSRTDYENRSNIYINEVLDDREGIPITLSVLYIEMASQLDLNIVGVGMPRHFLVRHEPKVGAHQLVDVFDRGRLMAYEDARSKFEDLADVPWQESYLNSITAEAMLERILQNLMNSAMESQEIERMLRYTNAILAIKPNSGRDHMFRGILCYQSSRWEQARAEVDWLMSHDSNVSQQSIDELDRAIRESRK